MNLGLAGCFQAGMKYAWNKGYGYAIQFDGDGQHDAAYLEQMAQKLLESGSDMVIGSRFIEKKVFSLPESEELVSGIFPL